MKAAEKGLFFKLLKKANTPLFQELGVLTFYVPSTWAIPGGATDYDRLFIFIPTWGTINTSAYKNSAFYVPAGQSTISFVNWLTNAGGVGVNFTMQANVFAIGH